MFSLLRRQRPAAALLCTMLASLLAVPVCAHAVQAADSAPETIAVQETFNHQPFEYQITSKASEDAYDVWHMRYPSPLNTEVPQNNIIPAEYYLPKGLKPGDARRPAVICMHILGGNFELTRMMCSALASNGVPAIMFKLPFYGERGLSKEMRATANVAQMFVQSLSQGMLDVRRTVDLLASRPEVDPEHIGITGISLGGIVTATAAGMEPRLTKAMPILAGGDVRHIIMTSPETVSLKKAIDGLPDQQKAELAKAIAAVEPLQHAPALKARAEAGKVLMVNAAEDEIIPRQCTEKLAEALGIGDRVIWLEGLGHYTAIAALPRIMDTMVKFFAADMPEGVMPQMQAAPSETPLKTIIGLLAQVNMLLSMEPKADACHSLDLEVRIPSDRGRELTARVRYLRGNGKRFLLELALPMFGKAMVGHGQYPWAVAKGNKVFQGSRDSQEIRGGPLQFVAPQNLVKIQMVGGTLAGVAMAPAILEQFIAVSDASAAGGPRTLKIDSKENQGTLLVAFAADGKTPREVSFEIMKTKGKAIIHDWQTNSATAAAEMFEPPHGDSVQEVEKGDLYRMFGALINFAMENLE